MKSARLLPWMVAFNKPVRSCLLVAVLLLLSVGMAQAQEIEGTWKLVMRKLQDGNDPDASSRPRGCHMA